MLSLVLLLAQACAAGILADVPAPLQKQLGVTRSEFGWVYSRTDELGGRSERALQRQDLERLGPFLDKLAAGEPERVMLETVLPVVGDAESPRAKLWLQRKPAGLSLTDEGRASVLAVVLGDERPAESPSFGQQLRADHPVLGLVIPLGEEPRGAGAPRGETKLDKSGALPVDWDGDRRGHVMPPDAEMGRVLADGVKTVDVVGVSSNYIYGGCKGRNCYSLRYEGETVGVGLRKGARVDGTPVELEVRLKYHKDGSGFQNGLIDAVETQLHAQNPGRFGTPTQSPLPHGGYWVEDGRIRRSYDGNGSSVGDVFVQVKVALLEGDGTGWAPRAAARFALNAATAGQEFTRGNYAAAGIGVTQRLSRNWTLNGELRATQSLDKKDYLGLPLKEGVVPGWTLAVNYASSEAASWVLQLDKNQTPYKAVSNGIDAYNGPDDALAVGYTRIIKGSDGRKYILQIWERENVRYQQATSNSNILTNLISRVRFTGNQAPDNQLGVLWGVLLD